MSSEFSSLHQLICKFYQQYEICPVGGSGSVTNHSAAQYMDAYMQVYVCTHVQCRTEVMPAALPCALLQRACTLLDQAGVKQ